MAVALVALAYGADQSTPAKKTASKTPAKTQVVKKMPAKSTAAHKTATKRAPVNTWRPRQAVPSPERYKEIQDALIAKGYLRPEDASTGWNQTSVDALKRFQGEQSLDASGKINSLSLIALGLGPKYDASPTPKPVEAAPIQNQDR